MPAARPRRSRRPVRRHALTWSRRQGKSWTGMEVEGMSQHDVRQVLIVRLQRGMGAPPMRFVQPSESWARRRKPRSEAGALELFLQVAEGQAKGGGPAVGAVAGALDELAPREQ